MAAKTPKPPNWLVASVVAAVVGALAAAVITPGGIKSAWGGVEGLVGGEPDSREQAVAALFASINDPSVWQGPPHSYQASKRYILKHFDVLDPLALHPFVITRPIDAAETVVARAEAYAGHFVVSYGLVIAANLTGPSRRGVQDTALQLISSARRLPPSAAETGSILYCLVPLPARTEIRPGMSLFVEGVPIADGNVGLTAGGFRTGSMMLCSAIAGMRVRCGRAIPAIPGTGNSCPGPQSPTARVGGGPRGGPATATGAPRG